MSKETFERNLAILQQTMQSQMGEGGPGGAPQGAPQGAPVPAPAQ